MNYRFPLFAGVALWSACSLPPVPDTTVRIETRAAFEEFTTQSCALIAYTATWCHPCHSLEPTILRFAHDHPRLPVGFVDIDSIPGIAREQHAETLPEVVVYRNGRAAPLRKHSTNGPRTDYRELTQIATQACPALLRQ